MVVDMVSWKRTLRFRQVATLMQSRIAMTSSLGYGIRFWSRLRLPRFSTWRRFATRRMLSAWAMWCRPWIGQFKPRHSIRSSRP